MKLHIASLVFGLLLQGTTAIRNGPRGGQPLAAAGRMLKEDENGDFSEEGSVLVEAHPCEADPQRAIDYVTSFGAADQGDADCLADPVNGCPGGCCRYSVYFVCDTENVDPYSPCVCNEITAAQEPAFAAEAADPVVDPMGPVVDPMGPVVDPVGPVVDPVGPVVDPTTVGNETATGGNSTLVDDSEGDEPTSAPLTAEEFAAQYPEIAAGVAAQNNAVYPDGVAPDDTNPPGTVLNAIGDEDKDDKDEDKGEDVDTDDKDKDDKDDTHDKDDRDLFV